MKEELEEVLGELAVMEEQERRRQGETEQSLQRLQRENRDLELQLSTAGAALDRWDVKPLHLLPLNTESKYWTER